MRSEQTPAAEFGRPGKRAWTMESVQALGLTTTVDTAASILRSRRTKAYGLAKSGDFPVKLVRVGRRYLVPVPGLLDLLADRVSQNGHNHRPPCPV